jgi:hypothetical protein
MIHEIIKTLRSNEFYGAGKYTEIAKGQKEIVTTFKGAKTKIKRLWLSSKN